MLELRTIFIFCGKVGNGWIERTFLIRSFDSERALKLCRNVGKKTLFVVKVYLFDEEEGTRTSWDLKSPLE